MSWHDLKKYIEYVEKDNDEDECSESSQEKESGEQIIDIKPSQLTPNRMSSYRQYTSDDTVELNEDFYSSDDCVDSLKNLIESKHLLKEARKKQNEYDFANSLLTIEYKPYNQYALATTLSLTESSVGNYYKAINSLKYQSNLTDKLVQISEFNFENSLKKLINTYTNIMPHLIYSLLKGKPVICVSRSCADLAYLESVVDCLSNFQPNTFYCLNSLTNKKIFNSIIDETTTEFNTTKESSSAAMTDFPRCTSSPCQQNDKIRAESSLKTTLPQLRSIYERKPIKLNDLKYCKLFGLCLMIAKDGCCSDECNENLVNNLKHKNSKLENGNISDCQTRSVYLHKHKHYHLSKPNIKNFLTYFG